MDIGGNMSKKTLLIGSVLLISSCGSGQSEAPPAETEPSTTVTTTSSTTTSTTLPTPGGNLDIHIDPAIESLPDTKLALESVLETERQYLVRPGTVALFYGSGESSVDWAFAKAKELNCFQELSRQMFINSVGWGRPCGFLMRVDGVNFECFEDKLCKQGRTVAAHEFFHVVAYQVLEDCPCEPKIFGNKVPNWLNEGIADYVGYAIAYGSTPGTLSPPEIQRLQQELKDRASKSEVAVGVVALEDLWAGGFNEPWFQYLYDRSFLAVTLLVEKYGEQAVLVDYFRNVTTAGAYAPGFEQTFGITEAEFDAEFQTWMSAL